MSLLIDRIASLGSGARVFPAHTFSTRPARVSVVIPCYNYGHYLPACLDSILSQPGVVVDAIVVDDASPDGSGDVAEQLAAQEPRLSVVRHQRNMGHIATYNDGLERAQGEYVVLLSADDLLTPGSLGRATALLEAHPSVGFTYGGAVLFSGERLPTARTRVRSWTVWPGDRWLERRWRTGRNCIWSPEVVMRAAVQRQIGGYRSQFPHTGDLEMWMRAAAVSDVGYLEGADQAFYRLHSSNMHAVTFHGGQAAGVLVDLQQRMLTFESLATESPFLAAPVASRRAIATEALKAVSRCCTSEAPDEALVDQLMLFARDAYPGATGLRWWGIAEKRRRAIVRGRSRRDVVFLANETALRAGGRARRWRWERVGA